MAAKNDRLREVALTVGKGVYVVNTALGDEAMDRVRAIINEACGGGENDVAVKQLKQEDIMLMGLLRLAWALDAVRVRLEAVAGMMDGVAASVAARGGER